MTCAELDQQIAMMLTAVGNLNAQISDKADEIQDQILVCIASDTWPGGPPSTWDETQVNSRIYYLQIYTYMHPELAGLVYQTIEKYQALKTLIQQKASLVAQWQQANTTLNNLIAQKTAQGCP